MRTSKAILRIILCTLLITALLTGCGVPDTSPTNAPQETVTQSVPTQTDPLPSQSEPTGPATEPIPRQNVLQSGAPKGLYEWVYTNYEQTFTWRDSVNNFCSVSITLPAMAPVADFAIRFNGEVWALGDAFAEEVIACQELETSNFLSRVTYESYLHDDVLSILLIENTTIDYTVYRTWSFDLEEQKELRTAELCDGLLDMDYPSFILATNAITAYHFKAQYGEYIEGIENQHASTDSYFETQPIEEVDLYHEILEQIPYDTVSIGNRQLFVGENGELMLIYNAPSLAGASHYPTIIPFDLDKTGWQNPSEETAYGEMLRLTDYVDGAYAESYANILLEAFFADSEDFVEHAAQTTAKRQEDIVSFLNYALLPDQVERFQSICRALLKDDDLSEGESALLNRLVTLSGI